MTRPTDYKIYRYIPDADMYDTEEVPHGINYVNGLNVRLHPIIEWQKGRILNVNYFASCALDATGEKVGSDLVVKENFSYTLDSSALARARTQTITWYREDGSAGDTKIRHKYYNNAESRTEGRRRRRNVIDNMSISVVGLLAATETSGDVSQAIALGTAYMASLKQEVEEFIEVSLDGLKNKITADILTGWLDNPIGGGATIRHFILGEIS